ncbi:hypothetical protein ACLOJK_023517 [Asimina triloba]
MQMLLSATVTQHVLESSDNVDQAHEEERQHHVEQAVNRTSLIGNPLDGGRQHTQNVAYAHTLAGPASSWYATLQPGSISTFSALEDYFVANFPNQKRQRNSSESLFNVVQGLQETLRSYVSRFTDATLHVEGLNPSIAYSSLLERIWDRDTYC